MKQNIITLGLCIAILMASVIYMATSKPMKTLHAGIGGTWSGASPEIKVENTDALKDFILNGNLSLEQRKELQAQLISQLISSEMADEEQLDLNKLNILLKDLDRNGLIQIRK